MAVCNGFRARFLSIEKQRCSLPANLCRAKGLVLVAVFFRDVVFRHFVSLHFRNVWIRGVLDSSYNPRLEILAFLRQLANALGVHVLDPR